jgi:hypothetical protein
MNSSASFISLVGAYLGLEKISRSSARCSGHKSSREIFLGGEALPHGPDSDRDLRKILLFEGCHGACRAHLRSSP